MKILKLRNIIKGIQRKAHRILSLSGTQVGRLGFQTGHFGICNVRVLLLCVLRALWEPGGNPLRSIGATIIGIPLLLFFAPNIDIENG